MSRFLWLIPMLLTLGLLASLAPPVTVASASSGEPSSNVLVAWPGWGVQQDLGSLSGTVGTFQIDVSAEPEADHVTLRASLVDAATLEVLRETVIEATPSYVPVSRTLEFPAYAVPSGQRLLLQLVVAGHERYHAIFRLAYPQLHYANLMLNGVPDSGSGPLVFSHQETVSGLRAALHGAPSERLRLAVAVLSAALAGLAHPVTAAGLRRLRSRVLRLRSSRVTLDRQRASALSPAPDSPVTIWGRLLATPWYPWPVAAIPILHFLTSNPLHFAAREAVLPIIVAITVVTVCVGSLRLLLGDWHRPAAATTVLTVVFFAYGHVEGLLDGRLDARAFFAAAVVLVAASFAIIFHASRRATLPTRFLNLACAVLLTFPMASLIANAAESAARTSRNHDLAIDDLAAHIFPDGLPTFTGTRPDIYYIILDSYVRADALPEFDNSKFLEELERRGFYIASEATSNYAHSDQSIGSSLNMSYLDALHQRSQAAEKDLIDIAQSHALGAILKGIGYTYMHLDSGFIFTDESPIADFHVKFTPAGTFVSEGARGAPAPYLSPKRPFFSSIFLRALVQTTALRSLVGQRLFTSTTEPYIIFTSPRRALQMFEFLTNPIEVGDPQFVFAHFGTPHPPSVFDQHGNYIVGDSSVGFLDSHDPSVPNAYVGEVIYINSLVIKMIDGILGSHSSPPIIVIASDHGMTDGCECPHSILAAFHLPHGGNSGLYPSISSVNHFRYILDYYFDFNLGLLDDVKIP